MSTPTGPTWGELLMGSGLLEGLAKRQWVQSEAARLLASGQTVIMVDPEGDDLVLRTRDDLAQWYATGTTAAHERAQARTRLATATTEAHRRGVLPAPRSGLGPEPVSHAARVAAAAILGEAPPAPPWQDLLDH